MSANRSTSTDFTEKEITEILAKAFKHNNAEHLAKFIVHSLFEYNDELVQLLLRRLHGLNPDIEYSVGMPVLIDKSGLYSWELDTPAMLSAGLTIPGKENLTDHFYVKGMISDISQYNVKPYSVSYKYISTDTTEKDILEKKVWVHGKNLKPAIDILEVDDMK